MERENKRAAIYPYNRKVSSLIRYSDLLSGYEIVSAIVPNGFNALHKDVAILEKRTNMGILGQTCFSEGIKNCDILIVAEFDSDTQFRRKIIENVIKAMSEGKDILSLFMFDEEKERIFNRMADVYSIKYTSYKNFSDLTVPYSDSLRETYAPIILVAGINEECQKFDIQLELKKYLENGGYRVTQIGSKHYSELFGIHSFPQFMYDTALSINDKVIGLNTYVRNLEKDEAPEVIVIGVPGGLLPITDKLHQNYGLTAFEVGFALQADICLLAAPPIYDLNFNALFGKIESLLGIKPCGVGISNIRFNQEATKSGFQGVSLDIINPCEVKELIPTLKLNLSSPIVNICDKDSLKSLFGECCKLVENYYDGINHNTVIPLKDEQNDDLENWLQDTIYALFQDLDRNLGIAENWKILQAHEILYVIAEVAKRYKILITAEDIYNGAINTYQRFVKKILSKL